MNYPRIVIAAPKSGSGKTFITCALLQALKARGHRVGAFKCGPDYIDPLFHSEILEVPSKNLDLFFTDEESTKALFLSENDFDISIIEGVMGLYDGLGGLEEEASTYHLAKTLAAPIVLVIDAHGMGRSVLAQIQGFLSMDSETLIRGIILNKVSAMFYPKLKELIEKELKIAVLGYFPKNENFHLESRHLGLKLPTEVADLREMLRLAGKELEKSIEVENLLSLAKEAKELSCEMLEYLQGKEQTDVRIAIAKDEAFCFYYADNLKMLQNKGAILVPFSPVHDKHLPSNIHGLILGGGYPELVAKKLEENISMRRDILRAIENGIPLHAECGGFLYLHENLIDQEGKAWKQVGAIPADCFYIGKLSRFGYVSIEEKSTEFLDGSPIKAHEFHYFDSQDNGKECVAKKPIGKRNWECIWKNKTQWMGFPHLYYPSNPHFVQHFLNNCKKFKEDRILY